MSKVPTIIIMCVVLFCILYFGKSASERVAAVFVPDAPTLDAPAQEALEADIVLPANESAEPVLKSGTVIYRVHQSAAQNLLSVISNAHNP